MSPQTAPNIDSTAQIASTARVHPEAIVGAGVVIGDFAIVDQDVVIGPGCRIEPYVWVKRWTTMGEQNEVSAGTVLGTDPLDKHFSGERSYLRIGNRNKIREHFTISRGTAPESETVIGDGNYIMTSGHIAHNAKIGDNTVIASCALVAGYVEVGDGAFISGSVAIHQFSKIGRFAMIGGLDQGQPGRSSLFPVCRRVHHSIWAEHRRPAPRGLLLGRPPSSEGGLQDPLSLRSQARRSLGEH